MKVPNTEFLASASLDKRNADNLVEFIDVDKTYDGKTMIVDRLNLSVRRGEFLTLLGPSGSGKTTCLMMLAGFEPWTRGDVLLGSKSLRSMPAHARGIGVVFQNYALFPHMTIAENIAFPLKQRKISDAQIKKQVAKALDMVELSALADRPPAKLSGGQQQRVALARALVFEPELVLMDEPLGALDKRLREQMQFEIKRLHASIGMTVLYVTHDQGEALTMSDRIAVFNKGKIEQIGAPDEIYERPATSFVANFVGENNRLDGKVNAYDAAACSVALDGGQIVVAQATRQFARGDAVELSIRPELISIGPAGDVANSVPAVVREVTYFGEFAFVSCDAVGSTINVKVPLGLYRQSELTPGKQTQLNWRREDCRVLSAV